MRITTTTDIAKVRDAMLRPKEKSPALIELRRSLDRPTERGEMRTKLRSELKDVTSDIWRLIEECVELGFGDVSELARRAGMERQALYQRGITKRSSRAGGTAGSPTHEEISHEHGEP